jgi:hypothetical protein
MLNAKQAHALRLKAEEKKALARIGKRIRFAVRKAWSGIELTKSDARDWKGALEKCGYRVLSAEETNTGKCYCYW